ncbi:MAG: sugar ABC transporter permease [Clostridia bacterium]|nr:sugar ABC transporter permease [Clostridia bacterium]
MRQDVSNKGNLLKQMKKYRISYLFVAPFLLIFCFFTVIPVLCAIIFGFSDFNMVSTPDFVGFNNYKRMFLVDELFPTAFRNTLLLATVTGPVSYLMSLMLAWFVSDLPPKIRSMLTALFYAPTLANVYLIWQLIFSGDSNGFLNAYLIKLGFLDMPVQWLTNSETLLPVLIFVLLITGMGTGFLTLIAGFANMDRTLFEAGAVDGIKNRWQELWYITLPLLKPQLLIASILTITSSFGIGGAIDVLCGNPSTDYKAWTLMNHLNDMGTVRMEMGYACAIATFLFIFMIGVNYFVQKLISKVGT